MKPPLAFPTATPPVCVFPVIDAAVEGQPTRACGEPATTTRKLATVEFPACARCAAALDAVVTTTPEALIAALDAKLDALPPADDEDERDGDL